jgi:hypothetical protein
MKMVKGLLFNRVQVERRNPVINQAPESTPLIPANPAGSDFPFVDPAEMGAQKAFNRRPFFRNG